MKTHVYLGYIAIAEAEKDVNRSLEFLGMAQEIAHYHHEKWDGSGYQDGLTGTEILISVRIMALADVFDALISRRIYKEPMPFDQLRKMIIYGRGKPFDPDMTDMFLLNFQAFVNIALHFSDFS